MALFTDSIFLDIIIFDALLLFIVYILYRRRYGYWKNRGVSGPEPSLFFGNMKDVAMRKVTLGGFAKAMYDRTKQHHRFTGVYLFHRPALVLNDLDLIKHVIIKDFAHFTDRGIQFDTKSQPLTNNAFTTKGSRWRKIRNKLTPAFTSNKMKYMLDLITSCGDGLAEYLKNVADIGEEFDVKDTAARYTTDAIACCAFGIESNCFKHPDAEFRVMGRKIATFSVRRTFALILMLCAPDIQRFVNGQFIEKPIADYFIDIVDKTIKHREKNNISRNDLIQLLIRLKNNESIEDHHQSSDHAATEHVMETDGSDDIQLDNVGIAAQSFSFFLAGFEATSTAMTFTLYELSENYGIQQKLIREIDNVLAKYDGKLTYEAIADMTYLTQVVEETLRMHSPAPQILRICTKDYTIPETDLVITKGTPVLVPVLGIHMDSKYYPNPDVFNPENFSAANKASRDNMTFIAFGEGPRLCIGMRFAMMQVKVGIISILRNYEVHPSKNTSKNKQNFNPIFVQPEYFLKLKNRKAKETS